MKEPEIKVRFDKRKWIYNPKSDITSFELAKIEQWLRVAFETTNFTNNDEYFTKYNLYRHFDEIV